MRRHALILAALLAAGCAPALREPPSIAKLAANRAPVGHTEPSSLLSEADAKWGKRPDVSAVAEAEALYLQGAELDETDVVGLIGAVRAKAWLADHLREAKARTDAAVSAVQTAQWCQRRKPDLPACDYWLAIAVGLQAREVRATADDGLKTMVPALRRVIEKDPRYDEAGPHRVLALVLVRAPGWPLGPGDVEGALDEARKAVELEPAFPPNQFALGEALAANKERERAREAYVTGKKLASERRDALDPDAPFWIVEADEALADLKP